jgi:hypothetical protein
MDLLGLLGLIGLIGYNTVPQTLAHQHHSSRTVPPTQFHQEPIHQRHSISKISQIGLYLILMSYASFPTSLSDEPYVFEICIAKRMGIAAELIQVDTVVF